MKSIIENGCLTRFNGEDLVNNTFNVPKNVKSIASSAFMDSENLKKINLNKKINSLPDFVFSGCMDLETVELPSSVKEIGKKAFISCAQLKNISIPSGVNRLDEETFSNCISLENVSLPKSLKFLGERCFEGCESIETVSIPAKTTEIGDSAFIDCISLRKVELPEKLEVLGDTAFKNCVSLESIELGQKLKQLEHETFFNCKSLKKVEISDGLEVIRDGVFKLCSKLQSVKFGQNVSYIGESAFSGCSKLETCDLPDSVEIMGKGAFSDCSSLKEVNLSKNLKVLKEYVFSSCTSLDKIKLNDGLELIGNYTFVNCESLTNLELPKTVKIIGMASFDNCKNLSNINLENINEIGGSAFRGCSGLKSLKLDNVKTIGSSAFVNCFNLERIELPANIENLGNNIFDGCKSLKEVVIDGATVKLTGEMKNNFSEIYNFLVYSIKNNKFIPKNISVMKSTHKREIKNFYAKSNTWRNILSTYLKEHNDYFAQRTKAVEDIAVGDLYKISTILGLFQEGENGQIAEEYVLKNIIEMEPHIIHEFAGMDTQKHGYNEEFAKFFMKNYRSGFNEQGMGFLQAKEESYGYTQIINYVSKAFNSWSEIKAVYPNKTVLADREHGSENNNLTEEDIINALNKTVYLKVIPGNEQMADIVGKYGYTQEEFERLQSWYETAKKIPEKDLTLKIAEDTETKGITFEVLKKDDPEALILGEKTNCCQTVNDAGSSCVQYGMTKPNSCFVKFCANGKLIGQSWVWYNEKTGLVCLDNIEVPTIWSKQLKRDEVEKSFLKCLVRLAHSIKTEMQKNGKEVTDVTIGAGYNDVPGVKRFEKIKADRSVLPSDCKGYSDATEIQYKIPLNLIKTTENYK